MIDSTITSDLRSVLRAISARINGEWDNPDLKKQGMLTPDVQADILRMISAIEEIL